MATSTHNETQHAADIPPVNIGIIGCGHLGRSLAKAFLKIIERTRLKISYSGNPVTRRYVEMEGNADLLATNTYIASYSDIVFIATRPADIASLQGIMFNDEALVVSCMAGCEIASLEKILQHKVIRAMPSSPVTIDEGKAVCAVYPGDVLTQELLAATGFTIYPLQAENHFHVFTACVCLPAAFLQMQIDGAGFSERGVIKHFTAQFAEFEKMFYWARALTPFDLPLQNKIDYIQRMATPGGITEAIVNSLKKGDGFKNAFQSGIDRSRQIATEPSGK